MANSPAAEIGMPLEEVETPALLLDLDAYERNLKRMSDTIAATGVAVRPHAKSHKCPVIALQQVEHGAVGVCCQKVGEAEAMVHGGVRDVFVSNEIIGASKLERLAALAQLARISVAVDHPENVQALSRAAEGYGVEFQVLVEINVMNLRCGVEPGEAAVGLARRIAKAPGLRFAGLHAYQGRAQHMPTIEERKRAIETAVGEVSLTRDLLDQAGIPCEVITGAGTGTYRFEAASGIYNEVQPGSYIFMDVDYGKIRGEGDQPFQEFEHSLFIYTQVMSALKDDHVVVDAGTKAMTTEKGMPWVFQMPGVEYLRASDEHGDIDIAEGGSKLGLGDKIKIIPPHCDPTVNLHEWYVGIRNDHVEALWPITARGAPSDDGHHLRPSTGGDQPPPPASGPTLRRRRTDGESHWGTRRNRRPSEYSPPSPGCRGFTLRHFAGSFSCPKSK